MCLGRETLEQPPTCVVAEKIFAALPWPCVVWGTRKGDVVMVNAAFRREFGTGADRAGPGWLKAHMQPTAIADEYLFEPGTGARPRRYRLTRQALDVPSASFQAIFLVPLSENAARAKHSPTDGPAAALATLRPEVTLTRRESQVLDGIMRGKLNKVIADELKISPKTVELHRSNLMTKLRVHNVVELARVVLDTPPAGMPRRAERAIA